AGLPAAFAVYHSHVEGLIVMSTRPIELREQLSVQYDRVARKVQQRVTAILAQFAGGPHISQLASGWHDVAQAALLASAAAVADGRIRVSNSESRFAESYNLSASPFHQFVDSSQELQSLRDRGYNLVAARLAVSGLYLSLGSLGIRLRERWFLCYAISRACSELFGLDHLFVVKTLAQSVRRHTDSTSISNRPSPAKLPLTSKNGDISWDERANAWRIRG